MRVSIAALGLAGLLYLSSTAVVQAHEDHCHQKGSDNKLVDLKGANTERACKAQNGEWRHHHAHCHKSPDSSGHQDLIAAKTDKECAAAGGKWEDHGHADAKP